MHSENLSPSESHIVFFLAKVSFLLFLFHLSLERKCHEGHGRSLRRETSGVSSSHGFSLPRDVTLVDLGLTTLLDVFFNLSLFCICVYKISSLRNYSGKKQSHECSQAYLHADNEKKQDGSGREKPG